MDTFITLKNVCHSLFYFDEENKKIVKRCILLLLARSSFFSFLGQFGQKLKKIKYFWCQHDSQADTNLPLGFREHQSLFEDDEGPLLHDLHQREEPSSSQDSFHDRFVAAFVFSSFSSQRVAVFLSFPFEGVAGGTASGKSTVCSTLVDKLGQSEVRAFLREGFLLFCEGEC